MIALLFKDETLLLTAVHCSVCHQLIPFDYLTLDFVRLVCHVSADIALFSNNVNVVIDLNMSINIITCIIAVLYVYFIRVTQLS